MNGVGANKAAMSALRHLNASDHAAQVVENRLSSGLKISSAKDNGATWSIAQKQRAEIRGLDVVGESLSRAQSTVETAIEGAERIREILMQLKQLALAASDRSLDTARRTALDVEFVDLRNDINVVANNTTFAGSNMIRGGRTAAQLGRSVTPLGDADGGSKIVVAAENLGLFHATNNPTSRLTLSTNSRINTLARATTMIATVDNSLQALSAAVGRLGVGAKALEQHADFTSKLRDSLQAGVSHLVDADLGKESARLQAIQARQDLGRRSVQLANAAPAAVLALFR
ncbi:MAG TPA: flagellin [Phenylobacterium sp.]